MGVICAVTRHVQVSEHNKRFFPSDWMQLTFSRMVPSPPLPSPPLLSIFLLPSSFPL